MSAPRLPGAAAGQPARAALATWDGEGGAGPHGAQEGRGGGAAVAMATTQSAAPETPELDQLRIRVIALENLVITLLADASERQLSRVRDMAAYIAPRPGSTQHRVTVQAAHQMVDLVIRAAHFQRAAS